MNFTADQVLLNVQALSGGNHFGLPGQSILNSEKIPEVWVYDPPRSEEGEILTDKLVNSMQEPPPLTVTQPNSLITQKRPASTNWDDGRPVPLAASRQSFSTAGQTSSSTTIFPNDFRASTSVSDYSGRGVTASEAASFQAGVSGRRMLGSTWKQICSDGTFASAGLLTMVQSVSSDVLLELPLTSNRKQLKHFFLWNLCVTVGEKTESLGFHIQLCLPKQTQITSASQLLVAINNFGALWDLCMDATGKTVGMRQIMSAWISALTPGMPDSLVNIDASILTKHVMKGLLKMATFLRGEAAGLLSHENLLIELTKLMKFDRLPLLMDATTRNAGKFSSFSRQSAQSGQITRKKGFSQNYSASRAPSDRTDFKSAQDSASSSGFNAESSNPCYATMLHKLGGSPKVCRAPPPCRSNHNLDKFSRSQLVEHAKNLKGAYAQPTRDAIQKR